METEVIDTYKNRDTITLLRGKNITEGEKKIIFSVLKHLATYNNKKVLSKVILLIPSFGYPVIPPCQAGQASVCPGIFEQPIFAFSNVSNNNSE